MKNASMKLSALFLLLFALALLLINAWQVEIILMSSVAVLRTLERVVQIGTLIFAGIFAVSSFRFVRSKLKEKRERTQSGLDIAGQTPDVQTLTQLIRAYLAKRNTTAFMKESVITLSEQFAVIQNRMDTVMSMVQQRFGNDSLGYDQFIVPVRFLYENLVNLGIDLMRRLSVFDAAYYQKKIDEGLKPGGAGIIDVREYQEIMDTYEDLVTSVIDSFENASLKLDKLILEIGAITSDEMIRSTSSLQELDSSIAAMKELDSRIVLELRRE